MAALAQFRALLVAHGFPVDDALIPNFEWLTIANVAERHSHLFANEYMSDCTLILANQEQIPVHTQILAAASNVFGTIFDEWVNNDEAADHTLSLLDSRGNDELEPMAVLSLLYFIYTGRFIVDSPTTNVYGNLTFTCDEFGEFAQSPAGTQRVSPPVTIDGLRWSIRLTVNNNATHLDISVNCESADIMPWMADARATLTIISPRDPAHDIRHLVESIMSTISGRVDLPASPASTYRPRRFPFLT